MKYELRDKTIIGLLCLFGLFYFCSCDMEQSADAEQALTTPATWTLRSMNTGTSASLRGLHVVNDSTIWASGSEGTFLRSTTGIAWESHVVSRYEHRDFRDVLAYSANEALLMAVDSPAVILRTTDSGASWSPVFEDHSSGVFLDGMDNYENLVIAYGDPIDSTFYGVYSIDRGKTWQRLSMRGFPKPEDGEAGYAASGTGIVVLENREFIGTGGATSTRVIRSTRKPMADVGVAAVELPLRKGPGCGVFSLAFRDSLRGIAVGGCYEDSEAKEGNAAWTDDGGEHWQLSTIPPGGYRSCVAYVAAMDIYICSGRNGVDISENDGRNWRPISTEPFYAIDGGDRYVWAVGAKGRSARFSLGR